MEGPDLKIPEGKTPSTGGGKGVKLPKVSDVVEDVSSNVMDEATSAISKGYYSGKKALRQNLNSDDLTSEENAQNPQDQTYIDSTPDQITDLAEKGVGFGVDVGKKAAKEGIKLAKDAPKKVANTVKGAKKIGDAIVKIGQVIGEAAKATIEFLAANWEVALIILAVILLIIIIIIIAIVLFYFLKTYFIDDTSNIIAEPSQAIVYEMPDSEDPAQNVQEQNVEATVGNARKLVKINDRKLVLDTTEFLEKIDEWFKGSWRDPVNMGVKSDYSDLVKFLEAEVITFYPDLRTRDQIGTEVPDGELQGCIQFNRTYADGTEQLMEFMPYEDYIIKLQGLGKDVDNNTIGDQNLTRAEVDARYNNLKDKFTLDENNNLILVSMQYTETIVTYDGTVVTFENGKSEERPWAEEENYMYKDGTEYSYSYTVTVKKVPYQNYVEKYSMPFELQTILLMATVNSDFCEALADLAKDSKIIINVQDNNTVSVETTKFSYVSDYEKKIKVYYYTYSSSSDSESSTGNPNAFKPKTKSYGEKSGGPEYEKVTVTDYETIETTNVYSTTELQWRLVDTWIAHVDFQYQFTPTVQTVESETTEDDDTSYKVVKNYHNLSYPDVDLPSGAHVTSEDKTIKEKRTNKVAKTTTVTTTNKYDKISEEVKETPEKFLSLIKVDPNTGVFDLDNYKNNKHLILYTRADNITESPMFNLYNEENFIYGRLASNNKTKDLEETIRYLIDLLRGRTTVDESRFSIYTPMEFRDLLNIMNGDYIVKTDEPNAAPTVTKEQLRDGLSKWISGKKLENALSVLDDVKECEDKYKVNGVFIYAIMLQECSMGTANTSWVRENNWCSLTALGHIQYESPGKNIEKMCDILAHGRYYFTQGKYSVYTIGPTYCNIDWANKVSKHMTDLYNAMGINARPAAADFTCKTVEAGGYVYPWYRQSNYAHVIYGNPKYGKTIKSSGCGPTSLSMILAGLLGDSSITPETLNENLKQYWPDYRYYVYGVGSSDCIYSSSFLNKYYGVTSKKLSSSEEGLRYLEMGYPCIGHEDGHILAVVPAPDDLKQQGYKFYILDSGRSHTGPYKSLADATNVVKGTFSLTYVIMP